MTVRLRLKKLESTALRRGYSLIPGCSECRPRRGRIVLVEGRKTREGPVAYETPYPEPCPACGKIAEFIVEVLKPLETARSEMDE